MAPGKLNPEETASMVERKVDHVLSHVDATDEQKTKVTAIAKATPKTTNTRAVLNNAPFFMRVISFGAYEP